MKTERSSVLMVLFLWFVMLAWPILTLISRGEVQLALALLVGIVNGVVWGLVVGCLFMLGVMFIERIAKGKILFWLVIVIGQIGIWVIISYAASPFLETFLALLRLSGAETNFPLIFSLMMSMLTAFAGMMSSAPHLRKIYYAN